MEEGTLVIKGPIAIGSDHAGFQLKEHVKQWLQEIGIEARDFGTYDEESTDYPDYGAKVAHAVSTGQYDYGIVICATGIGMSIVTNKFKGIRAALCASEYVTEYSRLHNDANILVLGGRTTAPDVAKRLLHIWLKTPFEGGRHLRRINKIEKLPESQNIESKNQGCGTNCGNFKKD